MAFLPMTTDFRRSSVSASWIHKEIRDGDLSNVIAACRKNPNLLWECNSRRWTTMHVLAISHGVYKWKDLLRLAASVRNNENETTGSGYNNNNKNIIIVNNNNICQLQTDMGDTCMDLFFRRSLYPLAWQRRRQEMKQRADLLRMSIEDTCSNDSKLHRLAERLNLEPQREIPDFDSRDTDIQVIDLENNDGNDPVDIVLQFWKNLELLLCEMNFDEKFMEFEQDADTRDPKTTTPVLHILSSLHWCPSPVAKLAIRLFPDQLDPSSDLSSSPLHVWARTEKSLRLQYYDDDKGMLDILCQIHPEAASKPDPETKNLPLQTALLSGKVWPDIIPLFEAYPEVLCHADTATGLPTFCLPAVFGPYSKDQVEAVAKRCDPQRLSVWCYISKKEKDSAIKKAQEFLDCQQLNTIYELLCKNPSAINMTSQ